MDETDLAVKLDLINHIQEDCTRCGLCLERCITYQASGWEHESPRGRIELAHQFIQGHILPDSPVLSTFDHCLACQACEKGCPQQIKFSKLLEAVQEARSSILLSKGPLKRQKNHSRHLKEVQKMSTSLWRRWKSFLEERLARQSKDAKANVYTLIVGCQQAAAKHPVIESVCLVLRYLGCEIHLVDNQPCCGASFNPFIYSEIEGFLEAKTRAKALKIQKETEKKFLKWLPPKTLFFSSGCRSHIQKRFSETQNRIMDLYLFIWEQIQQKGIELRLPHPYTAYYQPYCGQDQDLSKDPVWLLLKSIKGLTLLPIKSPKACCGGFGKRSHSSEQALSYKVNEMPLNSFMVVTSDDCYEHFNSLHFATPIYPTQILVDALP